MNKFFILLSATLLLFLVSCEEKTTWELQSSEIFAVADCILTNELKPQELRLYRSSEKLNEIPVGISGAVVEISDGRQIVNFKEDDAETGKYVSPVSFRATAGIKYRLIISLGEKADTAYAEMTGIRPLDNIDIAPNDSLYRLVYHESQDASMM